MLFRSKKEGTLSWITICKTTFVHELNWVCPSMFYNLKEGIKEGRKAGELRREVCICVLTAAWGSGLKWCVEFWRVTSRPEK